MKKVVTTKCVWCDSVWVLMTNLKTFWAECCKIKTQWSKNNKKKAVSSLIKHLKLSKQYQNDFFVYGRKASVLFFPLHSTTINLFWWSSKQVVITCNSTCPFKINIKLTKKNIFLTEKTLLGTCHLANTRKVFNSKNHKIWENH